ncbi:endo-1,4-beta-xylanase [Paenibacillus sp. GCM10023250]|uniref:endo-1,4-beta-xylanase n=1 Tax=Paenibacillus sp. GCM10023250 TaxID=3252648 RepID=UPI003611DDB4
MADKQQLLIGAAINYEKVASDSKYKSIVKSEFNMVTVENDMKFTSIHPARKQYDFNKADVVVNFALMNNLRVQGHTLVWHNRIPDWLLRGHYSKEEMKRILKDHIQTIVRHYKNKVYAWDVVNEAFNDDGSLRDSIWLRTIGSEYIGLSFQWAHEADPKALLFLNDFGIEGLSDKSTAVYRLISSLKMQGIPVNGVGFQMHYSISKEFNADNVKRNMKRYRDIGVEVHFSEVDIAVPGNDPNMETDIQGDLYFKLLNTCLNSKGTCTAFIVWGVTDKYSWLPKEKSPLIFDQRFRKKEAYEALVDALKQ